MVRLVVTTVVPGAAVTKARVHAVSHRPVEIRKVVRILKADLAETHSRFPIAGRFEN